MNIPMDIINETNEFLDKTLHLLHIYKFLGPFLGILLPFIEAFLPFLPLFIFVMANSVAFGLLPGFIYSWIGATLGSVTVFLLLRKFKHLSLIQKLVNNHKVQKITEWVAERGFGPLFVLLCFPFSPSSIINIVAAISRISFQQFFLAVLFGKAVMIFSIAYVGISMVEFAQRPLRTFIVIILISLFWFAGKQLERKWLTKM